MKYTLLLDSSNTDLVVGLADEDKILEVVSYDAWQTQSERMIVEIDNLLTKYQVDKNDIQDVMVAVGPGSYTGVRIAITIAKTIFVALHTNIYVVSSLNCLKSHEKPSICLINARSNRSYFAVYENEKAIVNDTVLTNDEVKKYIEEHPNYVVCGKCKYLGISAYDANIAEEMYSLKKYLEPVTNPHAIKPVYLKDY